jgi:ATP-dependent RNA helicase DDX42
VGEANSDVTQVIPIFRAEADKWAWLMTNLPRFCVEGSVLIFVSKRGLIDELKGSLNASSYPCESPFSLPFPSRQPPFV